MRTTDWLLLFALSVLWGLTYFFGVIATQSVPPLTLVLLRVALAAMVLVPIVHLLGFRLPDNMAIWRSLAILATLNNIIPFTLMFYGQPHVTGGLASVINATTPLFTILIARIFAHEPLSAAKIAGVLLGLAGVAVLMGPAAANMHATSLLGMVCFIGSSISYGFSALWLRRFRDTPPLVSAAGQLVCSSAMMLVPALLERAWLLPTPPPSAIGAVLGLAVLSTALAYVLFFRISATAGATNVMLVTLLIPVTATGLGAAFLGEELTAHQIVGALVIGSGLLIIDGRLLRFARGAFAARRLG
ncbi:MAG TPA: DMT family transporter [Hyphomicrobiaceae bacterium]|nr:DMT family transporter [Hyphomicrobiaceae bacterium]